MKRSKLDSLGEVDRWRAHKACITDAARLTRNASLGVDGAARPYGLSHLSRFFAMQEVGRMQLLQTICQEAQASVVIQHGNMYLTDATTVQKIRADQELRSKLDESEYSTGRADEETTKK